MGGVRLDQAKRYHRGWLDYVRRYRPGCRDRLRRFVPDWVPRCRYHNRSSPSCYLENKGNVREEAVRLLEGGCREAEVPSLEGAVL